MASGEPECYRVAQQRLEKREAFLKWLRLGSGVFYISGKAGAGKSTLMKYVSQDQKTCQELQTWAQSNGKQLILTRFFFWSSGDQLQKSLEGLYRAILWDILRQSPDFIPYACPDTWSSAIGGNHKSIRHHSSFDLKDLYDALERILTCQYTTEKYKLCLFIDGLDEFDGDYWKLSKGLSSWASRGNAKVCVSSQPYNEFEEMFASHTSTHLRLHDLTRHDMLNFVHSEFKDDKRSAATRAETSYYSKLVEDIVARSEGIFLLVQLVTYQMLKAMGNHSSLAQLRQQLDDIPQGLAGIYKQMIAGIEKPVRKRAAQMLLVMRNTCEVFVKSYVATFSMMDAIMEDRSILDSVLSNKPMSRIVDCDNTPALREIASRLIARCNGLVEMEPRNHYTNIHSFCLQFVHRTVADFLVEEEVHSQLLKLAGSFCPYKALLHAILALFKFGGFDDEYMVSVDETTLRILRAAESNGLGLFTQEMEAYIYIRQTKGENYFKYFAYRKVLTLCYYGYWGENEHLPVGDDIESVLINQGINEGCINFSLDCIAQNPALMAPMSWGGNTLIAATIMDLGLGQFDGEVEIAKSKHYQINLLVHHLLSINDSYINTPSSPFWEIPFSGSSNSPSKFSPLPKTTWTSFLFLLDWRPESTFKRQTVSDVIETFLEHGADASACFILCREIKLPGSKGEPSDTTNNEPSDIVFYATLPDMLERWGVPLGPQARQLSKIRQPEPGWSFSRGLGLFRATETTQLPKEQLDAQELATGDFKTIKVTTSSQLKKHKREDIRGVLKEWVTNREYFNNVEIRY